MQKAALAFNHSNVPVVDSGRGVKCPPDAIKTVNKVVQKLNTNFS